MDRPLKLKNKSTHSHGGTYDPTTGRLTVVMNGATIAHHDVPSDVVEDYEKADSHGTFYHQHIGPHYSYSRVR